MEADPVSVDVLDDKPEELSDPDTLVPVASAVVVVATEEDSVPDDDKLGVDWELMVSLPLDEVAVSDSEVTDEMDEAVIPEDNAVSVAVSLLVSVSVAKEPGSS